MKQTDILRRIEEIQALRTLSMAVYNPAEYKKLGKELEKLEKALQRSMRGR